MSSQTKPVFTRILTLNLIALALLSGCDGNSTSSPAAESKAVVSNSTTQQQDLKAFFESAYKENLVRSPMTMEIRGDKSANDRWDDWSEAFAAASQAIRKQQRNTLQQYPHAALSAADRLSFDIFDYEAAMAEEGYRFRYYDYPVNQMFGIQAAPITHLMNVHKLATVADAEAYIARLQRLPILFDQVIAKLQASAKQGIVAPRFALQLAAEQMRGLLTGTPFQPAAAQEHVILADFTKKLATLELQASEQQALIARAEQALVDAVKPAYVKLIAATEALADTAEIKGVWALPDGDAYYRYLLKQYTTTDMTPEQVHQLGWSEIRRLHGEIQTIMDKLGFSGDLHSFFHFTQEDPQFFYSKNDAGRARALADAENFISGFTAQLDDWFLTQPKASLEVKPVEAFREATSPVAFYNAGSPDGERAGIYYLNLFEPREMPIWQMAPIAYHEAIPGHHMQISIGQEMTDLPSFRKFIYYSAYGEGWGLYSEYLPKEAGFYQNPYDDYGRLVMELLRACRLVADSGIHFKHWSREQAIAFMLDNMPITKERASRSVQRYFVMPGQATAYKIGQLKLLELREKAITALADQFDIRQFHEVVLTNGAVPLNILEQLVQEWVDSKQG